MFVLPWVNRTLVGTTDTFTDEGPDEVAAGPEDVNYLLAAVNDYFGQKLTQTDAVATLAGLRPLVSRKAKDPSAVSREFVIIRSPSSLWSIAGGKYTTYRSMAQKLVDRVVSDLGISPAASPSRTARHLLIGAPAEDWQRFRQRECGEMAATYRLDPSLVGHLLDRYGVRARVMAGDDIDSRAWQAVVPGEPDVWAELRYQAQHEMAIRPADHLLRRTRLGLFHPELLSSGGEAKWPLREPSAKLGS
jgi:glycerol-3-phosphate dehydrogenase